MSLQKLIKRKKHQVFRKIYVKRRETGGDYEADWYEIPEDDIQSYGAIETGIEDVLPNFYSTAGLSFRLSNLKGLYSDTDESKSIFYNNVSINNTLVRIDAGYYDDDGTQYPTNATLFLGVIATDSTYDDKFNAKFSCKQLSAVFENFPADRVSGLGVTQTASELIEKVRDFQDTNGVFFFRKYFSLSAWNISTSTAVYNLATSTALQNVTVWDLMQNLAVAENYVVYTGNDQTFNFIPRSEVSATADFKFSGLGDNAPSWGFNIMGDMVVEKNYRKVYNRVKVQFNSTDTTTSYFIKNESFAWGDDSSSYKYGVREYSYKNYFLTVVSAETIADKIFNEYYLPKEEVRLTAKFLPHLQVGDRVTVSYKPFVSETGALWDFFLWGVDTAVGGFFPAIWAVRSGYNIQIDDIDYQIISIGHDIDNFKSTFTLRLI